MLGRAMTQAVPWPRLCHYSGRAMTQAVPLLRPCYDPGCAMIQAVPWLRASSPGLSPYRSGFDPRSFNVRFLVEKVSHWQVSVPVVRCHPVGSHTQVLHTLSFITRGWHKRPISVSSTRGLGHTALQIIKWKKCKNRSCPCVIFYLSNVLFYIYIYIYIYICMSKV